MKWTVLLFAASALCQAQSFSTGQAARAVIGQKPFTQQDPGASDKLLGSVGGVAYANDTLIVADSNGIGGTPLNQRVLVYRNVSSFVPDRREPVPQTEARCPSCVGTATNVLGQPDFYTTELRAVGQNTFRTPTGVAYNGRYLAVADSDNNRVLVWKTLPGANQANADYVVGQADFKTALPALSDKGLRGPTNIWLDSANGLWVADTGNARVLYYGEVTQNGQAAKFALGQKDLNSNQQTGKFPEYVVTAESLLAPTSVYSDGTRLYVSDLGNNRVLIWNAIPTRNAQPADVVLGQPDMTSSVANHSEKLCPTTGNDADGVALYPSRCAATLNFPRYVLSDGTRLFVADAGNDRVLLWNQIPRENGVNADLVLGQPSMEVNQASDSANPEGVAATDSFRTPTSLAWDGQNLYVSDTYNRRVMLYSPGDFALPLTAVRNAPSPEVYARGNVVFSGTIAKDVNVSIKIGNTTVLKEDGTVADPREYKYTTVATDTYESLIDTFLTWINDPEGGDQWVRATPNKAFNSLILTARDGGLPGNNVTIATVIDPAEATLVATASGANLAGGQNAARIAPNALVLILGDDMTDVTIGAQDMTKPLPRELGGVQFFVDGVAAPLVSVSPTRIVAQIPVETANGTSSTGIVRSRRQNGSYTVSTAVGIPIIPQNPAVFSDPSLPLTPGLAYHSSSSATGTVSVDGSVKGGDVATVTIRDRSYSYTVQTTDTLTIVRDNLVAIINANDPEVEASASGTFQRIRLRARVPGIEGNGIPFAASANIDAQVIMSAFNTALCCANQAGAVITEDNPAVPGETIVVLAGGLGLVSPQEARDAMTTGQPYYGPALNDATEFVSSLVGGKTANVLFAGLRVGSVGIYEVHLELNPDLPTNPKTEATIAQSYEVSNIFTLPVIAKQ
ncbi:MAG: hypothetical protein IPP47_04565 [Bryobacterales bacterium]|nr:hypothetical protein [Bryobacterales bacterium]